MKDGTASQTARSVAAHRLEFDRVAADYGDPAADRTLMADVADGQQATQGRMHDYLRARTDFFDRTVVGALGRGVRQVVIGGAGYDGRALRYARPDVRWFEVDHPATQADKLSRLARLGLESGQVEFVAADFTADPIGPALLAAGLDPGRPALFLLDCAEDLARCVMVSPMGPPGARRPTARRLDAEGVGMPGLGVQQ